MSDFPNSPPGPSPVVINMPNPAPAPTNDQQFISMEDAMRLVEKARSEEKDKLYPTIEDLQTRVRATEQEREARETEQARLQQEAAEADRLRQESEMSAIQRMEQSNASWEQRFADMEAERARERALLEKEREYNDLNAYRNSRVQAEVDARNIVPQFAVFIGGNTREEVETAIDLAKIKTEELVTEINAAQSTPPPTPRPTLPMSGMPAVDMPGGGGILGQGEQITITPEEIRNMSMAEFAEHRNQLLGAASERARTQGIYAQ